MLFGPKTQRFFRALAVSIGWTLAGSVAAPLVSALAPLLPGAGALKLPAGNPAYILESSDLCGGASQYNQISYLAAIERQFEDPLVLDHTTDTDASGFHQVGISLDLDMFIDLAYVKHHVDHGRAVYLEHDPTLYICPKTWQTRL